MSFFFFLFLLIFDIFISIRAYIKASAVNGAPIITAATNTTPLLPNEREPIPATSSQSDDGFSARRLSFSALSDSLRPANITNTAKGVVDAASTGARVAASVAGNWWSNVRRPSQAATAATTEIVTVSATKDNESIEIGSVLPSDTSHDPVLVSYLINQMSIFRCPLTMLILRYVCLYVCRSVCAILLHLGDDNRYGSATTSCCFWYRSR